MKTAARPFQFVTASYLTRIGNHAASNLLELADRLEKCSDGSIFHHTFQSLSRHHFLAEGFSNDFAQWALASCNRPELAERLASLDIRDYLSIPELRADLRRVVAEHCEAHADHAGKAAFEPFYFCEAVEVTVPFGREARSLEEFREGLERLSHVSFHYHFIDSRLRLHLRTNDFSHWFKTSLGLERLAWRADRIDIYTNTLEGAKAILLSMVDEELEQ